MTANKLEGKARELLAAEVAAMPRTHEACDYQAEYEAAAIRAIRCALDTARQSDAIHSCSYYCDRPDCVKAQRDQLREAYVARQSEGMVLVPRENLLAAAALLEGTGNVVDRREAEVLRKFAAAPADAGEATQPERDGRGNGR